MLKALLCSIRASNSTSLRSIYHLARIRDVTAGARSEGAQIQVKGWVKSVRKMKDSIFLDVNDGTCGQNLQLVVSKTLARDTAYGSSVNASGTLGRTPKNQLELKVDALQELGACPLAEGYPFYPKKSYPPDYIRNHLHLRPQVASVGSTLRVRHQATKCFNDYLDREGFVQIHTPIITSNDCEGAGEAFVVRPASDGLLKQMTKKGVPLEQGYFDRQTYLTVSGQLHLEAMAHGLGKVYTFGPTFRAENSKSPIHLAEFHMLELEEAFMDSLDQLADRIESMVKSVTKSLLDVAAEDLSSVRKLTTDLPLDQSFCWVDKQFPRITFHDAMQVLEQHSSKLKSPVCSQDGINKEQELFLVNHFQTPLFVTSWPKAIKSFYMKQNDANPELVDALDFLVPHAGELVGGSVRECDHARLKAKLPDQAGLAWYLDLRKFGSVPTAGFGLGLERYLAWVLNVHNVKDVIPFPRWAHNCAM